MSSNTSCAAMIAILVHNNEKRKKGRVPMKKKRRSYPGKNSRRRGKDLLICIFSLSLF